MIDVRTIWITSYHAAFNISICGFITNIYGTRKAAIASFDALIPDFRGSAFAIAAPAIAANAPGGVISAMIPK